MTAETSENLLTIKAYAKINLYLDVISRYPDGYHQIVSVMQSVSLHDLLEISEAPYPVIDVHCTAGGLSGATNLAYRAALELREQTGVRAGARISIKKNIPIAAGLAGGSADAAATLFGLDRLWGLNLSNDYLKEIATRIGADVPFCLIGGTMLAEGKGELLESLTPVPDISLVIATPPVPVSTAEVYRQFDEASPTTLGKKDEILSALREGDVGSIAGSLNNLLEYVVLKRYPAVLEAKDRALASGALAVLMSGSGPSVFALCGDEATALEVAQAMRLHDSSFFVEVVKPVRAGVELV
ncbi:MAG: 4-(cytidine 5'-diphospho)-2-C-methyl-D-erythritol kinase [Candidatus Aquicultor sp.]|nr:4-(cytidine 5'-diphospho)-2-C-methyl-D-erythritol kinase [Candidatus Aquicultor sp.]